MNTVTQSIESGKKRDDFDITVTRYYTDMSGVIIDKSLVPTTLKQKIPFYLFHRLDHNSGYKIGNAICPPMPGIFYVYTFTPGIGLDYFSFQFGNNVKSKFTLGDVVHVYTDDLNAPNYLIWIILHSRFQPYSGLIETSQGKIQTTSILYFTDNTLNYGEAIHMIQSNFIGIYKDNQYQPLSFKTPQMFQQDFIELQLQIKITDYLGLASYIQFTTDQLQFVFKVRF